MTNEDTSLLKCLPDKQERLRQLMDVGKPYVRGYRLSLEESYELETAIGNCISSRTGDYHYLLSEDFAIIIVMYLAEWFYPPIGH